MQRGVPVRFLVQGESPPVLTVVIVTYQSRMLVDACLSSLLRNAPKRAQLSIHVVDNASTDGTVDHVREQFPSVKVHPRASNDGFAVANNAVLSASRDDFVLVLNPDTRFENNAIDPLIERLTQDRSIAMIGCRLIQDDGTFDHAAKRAFPTPAQALKHMLPFGLGGSSSYTAPELAEKDSGYVDAINGAFMLIRREALEEVGLFDEAYWMYGEDLDLAKRMQINDWKVWYEGSVTVRHVKGGISGRWRRPRLNYEFHKSMAIYYGKFSSDDSRALDAVVYLGIAAKFVFSLINSIFHRRIARPFLRAFGSVRAGRLGSVQ